MQALGMNLIFYLLFVWDLYSEHVYFYNQELSLYLKIIHRFF